MTRTQAYWAAAVSLVAAVFAASAALYPIMPDRIPIHWNFEGKADGFGSRAVGLFLMPAIMAAMLVMFRFLPALSPKNFEVDSSKSTYLYVMLVVLGLLAYIHGVAVYAAWKGRGAAEPLDVGRVVIGGMLLFFGLLGNVMGKVQRNFYIGVRTPWTIASDRVWNDTHRLAAWLMVGGSLVGFLMVIAGLPLPLPLGILLITAIFPVFYSFVHYKRLEKRGAL